jgi:biopolymer transport protein ExbD
MKLSKTNPGKDIELDLTPMIDVTFQLIIFFMLLTDMTQKDLEELVLPKAVKADPDIPDPKVVRPVVNILADGRIMVKRSVLYDPAEDDAYGQFKEWLSGMARQMPTKPLDPSKPGVNMLPDNPILIRADQSTPFKHIQKVMEICGLEGIKIWKVQLAAAEDNPDDPNYPRPAGGR